jgi:hypothetical protein
MTWIFVALVVVVAVVAVVVTAFLVLRLVAQSGLAADRDFDVLDDDPTWYEDTNSV